MNPQGEVHNISVALSGGGYRAALFGGGALLALCDTGLAPEVRSITSVSGGSFTNVLTEGGFDSTEAMEERIRLLSGMAVSDLIPTERNLRFQREAHAPLLILGLVIGVAVAASSDQRLLVGLGPVALLVAIRWATRSLFASRPRTPSVARAVVRHAPWLGAGTWLTAAMWLAPGFRWSILMSFAVVGILVLMNVPFVLSSNKTEVTSAITLTTGAGRLSEFGTSESEARIHRVICATDTWTADHIYMARDFVLSRYGESRGHSINVGTAVAASAAFPGFRPISVTAEALGIDTASATSLMLVDGGVADNLAAAMILAAEPAHRLTALLGPPDRLLVVDASAPFRPKRDSLLARRFPRAAYTLKSIRLVNAANSSARLRAIRNGLERSIQIDGIVIDLEDVLNPGDDVCSDLRDRCASVPTTIGALDPVVVAELLFHGYRLARAKIESASWSSSTTATRDLDNFHRIVAEGPHALVKRIAEPATERTHLLDRQRRGRRRAIVVAAFLMVLAVLRSVYMFVDAYRH